MRRANAGCAWALSFPTRWSTSSVSEGEFADLANRNIHGEITHVRDWLRPVCPNQPDVREYAVNAFAEVIEKYQVDWVESAIVLMDEALGGSPARGGGCLYAAACKRAAPGRFGVDLEKIQAALLKDPASQPELGQWQQFRFASVAAFYKMLHAAVHKAKPDTVLRYNMHAKNPRDFGVDIVQLKPHLDALRIQDYSGADRPGSGDESARGSLRSAGTWGGNSISSVELRCGRARRRS